MLIYNPSLDCYHAIFRLLRLLEAGPREGYSLELVRLLDFYLLFPGELALMKFPHELLSFKASSKKLRNRFSALTNPSMVFHNLKPFQAAAVRNLAGHGLLSLEALKNGEVKRSGAECPSDLLGKIKERNSLEKELIYFLTQELTALPFHGPLGLKSRTGLLEYRYDVSPS